MHKSVTHVNIMVCILYLIDGDVGEGAPGAEQYRARHHGGLLPDNVDEEPGERHDHALGHPPGGLDHHEVRVSDIGGNVLPHVGGHVGRDVPEGVEGAHGELEQEPAEHGGQAPHREAENFSHNTLLGK